MESNSQLLKRNFFIGAILRLASLNYYGIEYTSGGINAFGNIKRHIPYSELSELVKTVKILGFTAINLRLKSGASIKVAGFKTEEAEKFIAAVNDIFGQYILQKFKEAEIEIQTISDALAQLDQPQQYPSACLLDPLLIKANRILEQLPTAIPEGTLTSEQEYILNVVISFQENSQRKRDDAIKRFVEFELSEMQAFFDTIETNPLTPEQRLAVVTDEDATLVLAGAGSGKTSVIVAKAAYLVERAIRQPQEILLMAFGKDAAAEMATRIKERSDAPSPSAAASVAIRISAWFLKWSISAVRRSGRNLQGLTVPHHC